MDLLRRYLTAFCFVLHSMRLTERIPSNPMVERPDMNALRLKSFCFSLMATLMWSLFAVSTANAAPNAEITVMPLGNFSIKNGVQELMIPLPRYRPLPPLVLASLQPSVQPLAGGNEEEGAQNAAPPVQVPATIKLKVNGRALPDWVLAPTPTAYVISPETLRGNPGFADNMLRIEVHLISEATDVVAAKLAMPDPMLLAEDGKLSLDGPLSEFQRRAVGKPQVAKYFAAQAMEFAGDLDGARAEYESLANVDDANVARFARRGLRLLGYRLRERTLSGNFLEHFRWGHHLRMAGFFGMAHEEFDECVLLTPKHFGGQYSAGETTVMLPRGLLDWMLYFDQAGLAIEDQVKTKSRINVAVIIVTSRNGVSLTPNQITAVKDAFICVDRLLNVASRGRLEMVSHWHTIDDADSNLLALVNGGVLAPTTGLIRSDGWFDIVATVLPRQDGESSTDVVVAGGDASTSNAMVANLFHDGGLEGASRMYYQVLRRLSAHVPALAALPSENSLAHFGLQPSRNRRTSVWSAVRDLCPPQSLVGVQIAQPIIEDSYLQLWNLAPLDASALSSCQAAMHAERLPVNKAGKNVVIDGHDVSLSELSQGVSKGCLASTWVYLPKNTAAQARFDLQSIASLRMRCNGVATYGEFSATKTSRSLFTQLNLKAGWNFLELIVEVGDDAKPSLALSILDWKNELIPGLACAYRAPESFQYERQTPAAVGNHYQWEDVREDWHHLLPNLTTMNLPEFKAWKIESNGTDYVGIFSDSASAATGYRAQSGLEKENFRDVRLNNVIDFRREWCAIVQGSNDRQLLFVRPEGLPAIVNCLKEANDLPARLQGKSVAQRLLGYVEVDLHDSRQPLFVFDVCLGVPAKWPTDEEDLLSPFGPYVSNDEFILPAEGPQPAASN